MLSIDTVCFVVGPQFVPGDETTRHQLSEIMYSSQDQQSASTKEHRCFKDQLQNEGTEGAQCRRECRPSATRRGLQK